MLRPLTTEDVPALLTLAKEMHQGGVYAKYPMDEARVAHILRAVITEPAALSEGYEIRGELVGAILGEVIQDLWIDVMVAVDHAFYVAEAHRGSMAGARLLHRYAQWAADMGADVLRPIVYAGVDNDAASALLQRMGYVAAGTVHKKELR